MNLQCPATLLVARHGDAAYAHPRVLSDDGGWLSGLGREQSIALATSLVDRSVAAVYTSPLERARETGAVVGSALGLAVRPLAGLQEFSVGALTGREHDDAELAGVFKAWRSGHLGTFIPGGESGQGVLDRYREALQTIADQHRGETVVVISHGGVMAFALPRLTPTLRTDLLPRMFVPNCSIAELAVDGQDMAIVSWPGSADRSVV